MSHGRRVPEGTDPFLSQEEVRKMAQEWKRIAAYSEGGSALVSRGQRPYSYSPNRAEMDCGSDTINAIHRESFIHDVIPRLMAKKAKGEKFKVLDIGAGVGRYADQLRRAFDNNKYGVKFEVNTTGLSKRGARKFRTMNDMPNLHGDELKWRSIMQLSDFPEYDLIIDTYGEQLYTTKLKPENQSNGQIFRMYLEKVISKLKGYASIYPVLFFSMGAPDWFGELEKKYNIRITLKNKLLKIEKLSK